MTKASTDRRADPRDECQIAAERAAVEGKDPLAAYEAKRKELGLKIDLPD